MLTLHIVLGIRVESVYVLKDFPEIKIQWNIYSRWMSHDSGFRCTNYQHEAEEINLDWDTCHRVLTEDEEIPAIFKVC